MLREVWRLQRDHFWTADMSGVDWNAIHDRYAPLLDRVATRGELSDLIWEMQGELGTSHAYEMGGDHRKPPAIPLGHLGAELAPADDDRGYAIARIVTGDAWEAGADSPLNAIGVQARVGERIVAVNGQPVSRTVPPQALLVHQAGSKVELTLASDGDGGTVTRTVLVHTLADEVPALYREWVERNRSWVHEESQGRVGYLHLPDMQAAGFAEFHRYFAGEADREALIVDLRYNRGGHVSQLLLEKFARKRIAYGTARWMRPSPYPDEAPLGPVVALTNEHAGSDGDIFSHNFKQMKIGPLVGTRTWGGVVGIWPRHALVGRLDDHAAGVLVLVQRRRLRRGELRHRPADRGRQRAAGRRRRPRPAAREGALRRAGRDREGPRPGCPISGRGRSSRAGRCRRGRHRRANRPRVPARRPVLGERGECAAPTCPSARGSAACSGRARSPCRRRGATRPRPRPASCCPGGPAARRRRSCRRARCRGSWS